GGGGPDRGILAVEVVLAYEDDREPPDRSHVEGFVECADVGGAIAEETERNSAGAAVPGCEGGTHGDRKVRPDDGERSQRTGTHVSEVHRATLPATQAAGLAEDLAEGAIQWSTH